MEDSKFIYDSAKHFCEAIDCSLFDFLFHSQDVFFFLLGFDFSSLQDAIDMLRVLRDMWANDLSVA